MVRMVRSNCTNVGAVVMVDVQSVSRNATFLFLSEYGARADLDRKLLVEANSCRIEPLVVVGRFEPV
ncbi:hypothetical protein ISN44_As03g008860 [Arabidopsis suecica]|uniref:Uncharacterized protein n=1 Tax=Arabidopsis suecica TaxID=45249 RepID=A0A8T2F4N8_ARASU|nr:hypothetical protein ISN44_As03g008860 [Arabidopsis suecica]